MRIKSKLIAAAALICVSAFAQQPVGVALVGTTATATGNGTTNGGTLRVTLSSDSTGQVALAAGANTIGAVTQASGPWTVNLTQMSSTGLGTPVAYGSTPTGNAVSVNAFVTNSLSATFAPSSSSGQALTRYHAASAAAANIKASAGNLYGLVLGNNGTVPCWLQLMNTSGTPTAGTSVVDSYMVQAGLTVVVPASGLGLENFATGIGAAGATADSGATTTGCTTTFSVTAYYF